MLSSTELSKEDKAVVKKLKKTDQEVRAHEQAHKNAGGQYAGSASYGYQLGPDGRRYAVSGEVSIDTAPIEGNPQATIDKLNVVIAAALAPAHPSAQDHKVAAQAAAARNKARAELVGGDEEELADKADASSLGVGSENISAITAYHQGADLSVPQVSSGAGLNLFS